MAAHRKKRSLGLPQVTSHETVGLVNAESRDAHVSIMVFYTDRPSVGPYRLLVPAERMIHVQFDDLSDPAPISVDRDFASLISPMYRLTCNTPDSTLATRKTLYSVRSHLRETSSASRTESSATPACSEERARTDDRSD